MTIDWISRAQNLSPRIQDFVEGRWQSVGDERAVEKYSPRDGQLLYRLGAGAAEDADWAVESARRAFEDGRWSRLPLQRRKDALYRLAALLEEHREELALLECLDVGKPISEALNFDVPTAAACIRFNAEAADKFYGKVYCVDRSNLSYELRRPVGVVVGIVGWNFPLVLATQKIGPVLATGNSLVLKPSEVTSLSAARVAELAVEAGIPPGVFNVVHGDARVGAALAHHRDVDLLTFTGSTRTGKQLLIAAGESNMKRLILECGGKAPNIVFDDCPNLDAVAQAVVNSAYYNQGEVCVASSRLLVHAGIKDELLRLVIEKASVLVPGDPLHTESTFGALVSLAHKKKVLGFVEAGITEGARVVCRSQTPPPHANGFYMGPTILDNVEPGHKIAQEEIFGPVLSVLSFRDEEQAIRVADSTVYGLSAVLWTGDFGRAHRVSQAVKAGSVVANVTGAPQGGPGEGILSVGGHKQSGLGAEGGIEGLEAYTSKTAVQIFI